jgi:predicted TIM-barrel fold metal-dependent hydrolase
VLTITDTHQHLIYPERYDYAWTVGIAALEGRAFRQADYTGASRGCGIGASVFMEATGADPADHDEASFIGELAADRSTRIVGIVAACRPEHPGFAAFLDSLAGSPVVGLRRVLHVVDDEVSRDSLFRENVRRLAAPALTFDLCVLARQLPLAHELAAAAPQVSFVLDHCGVPDIAAGALEPWQDDIERLAELPNVACKISGVLSYCDPQRADLAAVAPYVEHCIAAFGWDRLVWGSDWPLVEINSSLGEWVSISRQIVAGADEADQRKLFSDNAARIYGLRTRGSVDG